MKRRRGNQETLSWGHAYFLGAVLVPCAGGLTGGFFCEEPVFTPPFFSKFSLIILRSGVDSAGFAILNLLGAGNRICLGYPACSTISIDMSSVFLEMYIAAVSYRCSPVSFAKTPTFSKTNSRSFPESE